MAATNIARQMAATPLAHVETGRTEQETPKQAKPANPVRSFGAASFQLGNGKLTQVKGSNAQREIICTAKIPMLDGGRSTGLVVVANVYRLLTSNTINGQTEATEEFGVYWPKQGFEAGFTTDSPEGVSNLYALESYLMQAGSEFWDSAVKARGTVAGTPQGQRPRLIRTIRPEAEKV